MLVENKPDESGFWHLAKDNKVMIQFLKEAYYV